MPSRGYERFQTAWLRMGLFMRDLPLEAEWEELLEQDYQHDFHNISPTDLFDVFPEAAKIIKARLVEASRRLRGMEPLAKQILEKVYEGIYAQNDTKHEKFWIDLATSIIYQKPLNNLRKQYLRLGRLYRIIKWQKRIIPKQAALSPEDVERAKEFPLTHFLSPSRAGFVLCPFHNEKTPSLKIYKEQNKWWCFGCQQGGDVINFVIKKDNLSFAEAVRFLR